MHEGRYICIEKTMAAAFCLFTCCASSFRPFLNEISTHSRPILTHSHLGMELYPQNPSQDFPARYFKASAFSNANAGNPASVSTPLGAGDCSSRNEDEGMEAVTSFVIGNDITLEEWQAWGTCSQIPAMVKKTIDDLNLLERELEIKLNFCTPRGKLQGQERIEEDKKHRATYKDLLDSEQKLQFFTARQVAYRLLGSRGYLCQNCWLPLPDCMCSKLIQHSLWPGIRFWLYMHPKDFLRKNNTGKLLWQVFGKEAARLCIFGIQEHEETMWNAFKLAGRDKVWCLYPDTNSNVHSVEELSVPKHVASSSDESLMMDDRSSLNFIMVDGTWSNSRAMFCRLKEHAHAVWGGESLPCLALSHSNLSVMHRLRPQPSLDRTCTAGAAVQLLYDLCVVQELEPKGLDQSAKALENSLDLLLNALSGRRQRFGKPIVRAQRWKENV